MKTIGIQAARINGRTTLLLILLSIACACVHPSQHRPAPAPEGARAAKIVESGGSSDSWHAPPEDSSSFDDAEELPEAKVLEVIEPMIARAVELLTVKAAVPLSSMEATTLTGIISLPRGKYYLVRGLCFYKETGGFSVYRQGELSS